MIGIGVKGQMTMISGRRIALSILSLILFFCSLLSRSTYSKQAALSEEAERGRQIYLRGASPSGQDITAVLGGSGLEIPGKAMACVNCHGRDGRGKPEGGITPSDITWSALTKPYTIIHESGRKRPPYTERFLKRAITMGLDPAGNSLHPAMPRFRLSHADMADLIAYLKNIEETPEPGLTQSSISIGTLITNAGPGAEPARAVKAVLAAYFDDLNRRGGVFNRKITLETAESSDSPEARVDGLRALLDSDEVFALAGVYTSGAESEIAMLARDRGVPLIGAISESPDESFPLNRFVFYIHAGLSDQARALAIFAANRHPPKTARAAIIYSDDPFARQPAEAIKGELKRLGWNNPDSIEARAFTANPRGVLQELSRANTEVVFYLGPPASQREFLDQAAILDPKPDILIPGPMLASESLDAPESVLSHIFLSLTSLPADLSPEAVGDYRRLAQSYNLPKTDVDSQLTALASARVLVEAFKRAGRDLSRNGLIEALEQLYQFETGLGPPLTFGPNRRVGSRGAHIVSLDKREKRFVPTGKWIELN